MKNSLEKDIEILLGEINQKLFDNAQKQAKLKQQQTTLRRMILEIELPREKHGNTETSNRQLGNSNPNNYQHRRIIHTQTKTEKS